MSFLKNTLLLKRFVILISFSIVSLILWNTYSFFNRFKNEERLKMEIVATAMKEFAKNQNLEADISLEDKIIKSNTNIPMILVDENGNIGADSYLNLDPEKAKDPAYLQEQLEIMKEQNNPIEIDFAKKQNTIYLLQKFRFIKQTFLLSTYFNFNSGSIFSINLHDVYLK